MKRKNRANQIWSMEKLENKIIDMREMYEERKSSGQPMMVEDTDSWVCCCCMAFADLIARFDNFFLKIVFSSSKLKIEVNLSD